MMFYEPDEPSESDEPLLSTSAILSDVGRQARLAEAQRYHIPIDDPMCAWDYLDVMFKSLSRLST